MELQAFLQWVVASGGAGIITYFALAEIEALANLKPEPKRYVAIGISAVLAVGAYLAMVGMNYMPAPQEWTGWVEQVFLYATTGFGLSQIIHARADLKE